MVTLYPCLVVTASTVIASWCDDDHPLIRQVIKCTLGVHHSYSGRIKMNGTVGLHDAGCQFTGGLMDRRRCEVGS